MSKANDIVLLEIPREIPELTKMTPSELKQELALALFAQGKISLGKASELSGLSIWQFQNELGRRGIQVHYDCGEFAEDLVTLREVGRL